MKMLIFLLLTTAQVQANYTCRASSNGYVFLKTRSSLSIAKKIAIASCKDHSRTSSVDCSEIVDCSPGDHYKERYVCETFSNGYVFSRQNFSREVAKLNAIDICNAHSRTTSSECNSLIQCKPINDYPAEVSCRTESNGYIFTLTGWDKLVIHERVISRCQDHSRTTKGECREFVECEGDSYTPIQDYTDPIPPRYSFRSDTLSIAEEIISVIDSLENFASSSDWNEILLPIKKQAGRLSARVTGRASFDRVKNTLVHLDVLLKPIDEYVDENMERDALFDEAKRLLAAKEKVKSVLSFLWDFKGQSEDLY